ASRPTYLTAALHSSFSLLLRRPPPRSTLFPYTTLFRSLGHPRGGAAAVEQRTGDVARNVVMAAQPARERVARAWIAQLDREPRTDRKSTRLNSSHVAISYAVFCLKKKKNSSNSQRMRRA